MNGACVENRREEIEEWLEPSIPEFLVKEEVSTPCHTYISAGQQRGGCSHTRCHTCREREKTRQCRVRWLYVGKKSFALSFSRCQNLKTNQEMSLTKLSLMAMPAPASKMEEWVSPMKSEETTCKTSRHKRRSIFDAEFSDYLTVDWMRNNWLPGPPCNPVFPSWVHWLPPWRRPWCWRKTQALTDGRSGPPRTRQALGPWRPCLSASWRETERQTRGSGAAYNQPDK